jgi:hypothetical protein
MFPDVPAGLTGRFCESWYEVPGETVAYFPVVWLYSVPLPVAGMVVPQE